MFLNKLVNKFNKISPVIIITPWVGAVGNMAEHIYLGLLKARRDKKKVLFLFPYDFIISFSKFNLGVNSELKKIESPYRFLNYYNPISILLNLSLTIIYIFLILLNKIFKKKINYDIRIPSLGNSELYNAELKNNFSYNKKLIKQWRKDYNSYIEVKLNQSQELEGKKFLLQMGLPKNSWFACLYVREGGYYSSKVKETKSKILRNCNIDNYISAIEEITKRGGYVIRMGDISMKKLPKMKNLIDYPFTPFKSNLMDVYLISKCKFFLSNVAGIWDVANLFQKPLAMTNIMPYVYILPPRKGDLLIYKHMFCKKSNRKLPLSDRLKINHLVKGQFREEYFYSENTSKEIKNLVIEFLEKNKVIFPIQRRFKRECIRNGLNKIQQKFEDDKNRNMSEQYKIFTHLVGRSGNVSYEFLKENF